MVPAWALFTEGKEKCDEEDPHLVPSRVYGVVTRDDLATLTGNHPRDNEASAQNMKHVEPNDFIISMGSHESGIEHSRLKGKVSNDYRVLRPTTLVDPEYYKWFLKASPFIEALRGLTTEIRVGQRISYTRFSLLRIPLPPLTTQQRIADYLDRETAEIDAAVADLNQYVELLEKRREIVVRSVLEKVAETGPNIPLGAFASFHTGWTPPSHDQKMYGGPHKWASIADLGSRIVVDTKKQLSGLAIERHPSAKPALPGDLLFSFKLSVGTVSFAGDTMYTNEAIAVFVPTENLNLDYAYYMLPVFVPRNAETNIYGAPLLNSTLIRQAKVPLPTMEKQANIARHLDIETAKIDALVADATKLRDLLLKRRAVLINDVVTGKKQV